MDPPAPPTPPSASPLPPTCRRPPEPCAAPAGSPPPSAPPGCVRATCRSCGRPTSTTCPVRYAHGGARGGVGAPIPASAARCGRGRPTRATATSSARCRCAADVADGHVEFESWASDAVDDNGGYGGGSLRSSTWSTARARACRPPRRRRRRRRRRAHRRRRRRRLPAPPASGWSSLRTAPTTRRIESRRRPDGGAEELRYYHAGVWNDRPDVVVTTTTPGYAPVDASAKGLVAEEGGQMAQISLPADGSSPLELTFTMVDSETGEAVQVGEFYFTIFDIDGDGDAATREEVKVTGESMVALHEPTNIVVGDAGTFSRAASPTVRVPTAGDGIVQADSERPSSARGRRRLHACYTAPTIASADELGDAPRARHLHVCRHELVHRLVLSHSSEDTPPLRRRVRPRALVQGPLPAAGAADPPPPSPPPPSPPPTLRRRRRRRRRRLPRRRRRPAPEPAADAAAAEPAAAAAAARALSRVAAEVAGPSPPPPPPRPPPPDPSPPPPPLGPASWGQLVVVINETYCATKNDSKTSPTTPTMSAPTPSRPARPTWATSTRRRIRTAPRRRTTRTTRRPLAS